MDGLFSGHYAGEDDGAAEHSRRTAQLCLRMFSCRTMGWIAAPHATEIRCLVGYAKMYDFLYLPRDFKAMHLQCFGICRHV